MKTDQELQAQSYARWMTIHELVRNDCLNALRGWISVEIISVFRKQLEAGEPIGGAGFHLFGGGMSVRNRLRTQLIDEELPPVDYSKLGMTELVDGKASTMVRNWDDYYMGALQELIETTPRAA